MLRLRVRELLAQKKETPYWLAKSSGERISMSTVYRLAERDGRLDTFGMELLEALMDVFGVPIEELIERVPEKRGKR